MQFVPSFGVELRVRFANGSLVGEFVIVIYRREIVCVTIVFCVGESQLLSDFYIGTSCGCFIFWRKFRFMSVSMFKLYEC